MFKFTRVNPCKPDFTRIGFFDVWRSRTSVDETRTLMRFFEGFLHVFYYAQFFYHTLHLAIDFFRWLLRFFNVL